jgi:hypothetical protein
MVHAILTAAVVVVVVVVLLVIAFAVFGDSLNRL